MLFSRNLFAVLLAFAAVNAIPSPHSKRDDDPNGASYCTSNDLTEPCHKDPYYPGLCADLFGSPFNGKIRSFRPPPGTYCDLFPGYKCRGLPKPIPYPGTPNVGPWRSEGSQGSVSSYRCY